MVSDRYKKELEEFLRDANYDAYEDIDNWEDEGSYVGKVDILGVDFGDAAYDELIDVSIEKESDSVEVYITQTGRFWEEDSISANIRLDRFKRAVREEVCSFSTDPYDNGIEAQCGMARSFPVPKKAEEVEALIKEVSDSLYYEGFAKLRGANLHLIGPLYGDKISREDLDRWKTDPGYLEVSEGDLEEWGVEE